MSPAWLPLEPVEIVTLDNASWLCSVATLITLLSPVAMKPDWLASAPLEMVTL